MGRLTDPGRVAKALLSGMLLALAATRGAHAQARAAVQVSARVLAPAAPAPAVVAAWGAGVLVWQVPGTVAGGRFGRWQMQPGGRIHSGLWSLEAAELCEPRRPANCFLVLTTSYLRN